ncbi:hypothetical protein MSAN_01938300 [Mycena sanguinolenta]|uniref:Uncharacterized protein n=1 Tax=Mycena sanguinolenta TaxID=230812 RepID=A0A8H7CR89_9AGAR|nr:hypothetical protein MSAN_01938300 [Mycena sanguinolenta]
MPSATPSNSDSDSDGRPEAGRELVVPDQNATPRTVRTALHNTQKMMGVVLKKNKELEAELAQLRASNPGRRKKQQGGDSASGLKGPNTLNYHAVIINLGKSFTVLQFPWVDQTAFAENIGFPEASPSEIWRPNPPYKQFSQQLTAMLYQHIPPTYHVLIAKDPDFAHHFCGYGSAERSTALKTIKTELTRLLLTKKLIANAEDPKAWRDLVVWHEDTTKEDVKISPYPPILYRASKKKPNGLMKNPVLPLCARAILFGPASLQDNGTRRPQGATLGVMWRVKEPTTGLISFVCTVVVFICYWSSRPDSSKPENFEPTGSTSKISFRDIYMRFRRALESKAEDPITKSIILFLARQSSHFDEDEELENAMGNMSLGEESSDEDSLTVLPVASAQPAVRAVIPAPPHVTTPPIVPALMPVTSDEELDESIASPIRRPHRRSHTRVPDSDDEAIASAAVSQHNQAVASAADSQRNEAGGSAAEHRLDLENKLSRLKVADLKSILAEAQHFPPSKTVKKDLVAMILAHNVATDIYHARFSA